MLRLSFSFDFILLALLIITLVGIWLPEYRFEVISFRLYDLVSYILIGVNLAIISIYYLIKSTRPKLVALYHTRRVYDTYVYILYTAMLCIYTLIVPDHLWQGTIYAGLALVSQSYLISLKGY